MMVCMVAFIFLINRS